MLVPSAPGDAPYTITVTVTIAITVLVTISVIIAGTVIITVTVIITDPAAAMSITIGLHAC